MEVQIGSLEITHLFCMPDIQNIKKKSAEWKVVDAFLSIILHGIQKKLNKLLKSIVKNEFRWQENFQNEQQLNISKIVGFLLKIIYESK